MEITCVICTDLVSAADVTCAIKCGHVFHLNCVNSWIERSNTCPQCRIEVNVNEFNRLYFNVEQQLPPIAAETSADLQIKMSILKEKLEVALNKEAKEKEEQEAAKLKAVELKLSLESAKIRLLEEQLKQEQVNHKKLEDAMAEQSKVAAETTHLKRKLLEELEVEQQIRGNLFKKLRLMEQNAAAVRPPAAGDRDRVVAGSAAAVIINPAPAVAIPTPVAAITNPAPAVAITNPTAAIANLVATFTKPAAAPAPADSLAEFRLKFAQKHLLAPPAAFANPDSGDSDDNEIEEPHCSTKPPPANSSSRTHLKRKAQRPVPKEENDYYYF